jgi:ATP-dependent Clp protease ATP-binding subunit ClpA
MYLARVDKEHIPSPTLQKKMSTPPTTEPEKKTSESMTAALSAIPGVATPEKLFLHLLEKGPKTRLWSALLRLNLDHESIMRDLTDSIRDAKIETHDDATRSPQLKSILMIAEEIAGENEDPHKNCLGVREFFLACIRHRTNHVVRILTNNKLSLEDIVKRACQFG